MFTEWKEPEKHGWDHDGKGAPVWLCDHHARVQQEDLGLDLRGHTPPSPGETDDTDETTKETR